MSQMFTRPTLTTTVRAEVSIVITIKVALGAMGSASINSRLAYAPQNIFPIGNGFKMCGVYAVPVSAEMINNSFLGDRTYQQFVCEAVSTNMLSPNVELTVPRCVPRRRPQPAFVGTAFVYLRPEASFRERRHLPLRCGVDC